MKYTIETEITCIRIIEVDAETEGQAKAAAEDYMTDHMSDASAHSVQVLVNPVGFEGEYDERITALRKGEPDDYYGYEVSEGA